MFEGGLEIVGLWVAALLTMIIFSFLYKDNPVYKVAEHIFLGVALGYSLSLYYWQSIFPNAISPLFYPEDGAARNYIVLIPMVLGVFILFRLVPKLSWLSRYSFAVYIGGAMGVLVPTVIAGTIMPQLIDTMQPLSAPAGASHAAIFWAIISRLLILIGVFTTLLYFFYSLEHKGTIGKVSRLGVFFIMVGMGASFGNTVMARVSLLIGRFQFLLYDWFMHAVMHRT